MTTRSLTPENKYAAQRSFDTSRIYFAQVMDTRDPLHAGRLKVWVISSQTDKTDKKNWVIARHASSWYGTSIVRNTGKNESPISYGDVNGIPYPGTLVAIFYPPVVGENTLPYWFACPIDDVMNVMAAGEPGKPPHLEENILSKEEEEPEINTVLTSSIQEQGLEEDKLRGYANNTPDRNAFPTSYAFTSPLGNTIVMDDGWSVSDPTKNWDEDPDGNELKVKNIPHEKVEWEGNIGLNNDRVRYNAGIRLRTRNGTQLLISDNGNIYAINKNGSAWLELSNEGYIDCWAENGISMATKGDYNIKCSGNMNFDVGGTFNLQSANTSINTSKVDLDTDLVDISGSIRCENISASSINTGEIYSLMANMTGTFSGTLNGTAFMSNLCSFTGTPLPMPLTKKLDTAKIKKQENKLVKGEGDSEIYTINSRVPTHEPWTPHNLNKYFPDVKIEKQTFGIITDYNMKTDEYNEMIKDLNENKIRYLNASGTFKNYQNSNNERGKFLCLYDKKQGNYYDDIMFDEVLKYVRYYKRVNFIYGFINENDEIEFNFYELNMAENFPKLLETQTTDITGMKSKPVLTSMTFEYNISSLNSIIMSFKNMLKKG